VDTPSSKAGLGVLGAGAAACAACCAGPVLGFLAATGMASVLGLVAFGLTGLILVLAVAAVLSQRRRRHARRCDAASSPAQIDAPRRKTKSLVGDQ
jgi:mercuric ion transport protein